MNAWMMTAAVLSLVTAAVHVFAGGRDVARPMLASCDLHAIPKFTNYYCWHMVTMILVVMAAAFVYAAMIGARDIAILATLLAMAFASWSLALIAWKRLNPVHFPQWILFLSIAAAGIMALS